MVQLLQNGDLHLEFFQVVDLLLWDTFASPHQAELSMLASTNHTESSFSEGIFIYLIDVFDFGMVLLNEGGLAYLNATSVVFLDDMVLLF